MLILSYLGEAGKFDLTEGVNLLGVRNPPDKIPENFVHVPQLSPSKELFSDTQVWKNRCSKKEEWWGFYEERFVQEMNKRNDLVRSLNRLDRLLQEGKLIRFFCYCKHVCFCHRSLIGKEMIVRGHEVDFRPVELVEQLSLF